MQPDTNKMSILLVCSSWPHLQSSVLLSECFIRLPLACKCLPAKNEEQQNTCKLQLFPFGRGTFFLSIWCHVACLGSVSSAFWLVLINFNQYRETLQNTQTSIKLHLHLFDAIVTLTYPYYAVRFGPPT